jgi:hypothetical protein
MRNENAKTVSTNWEKKMREAIRKLQEEIKTKKWMTTTEALTVLNKSGIKITQPTLVKFIRRNQVEGKMIGRRYFITVEAVMGMLNAK